MQTFHSHNNRLNAGLMGRAIGSETPGAMLGPLWASLLFSKIVLPGIEVEISVTYF